MMRHPRMQTPDARRLEASLGLGKPGVDGPPVYIQQKQEEGGASRAVRAPSIPIREGGQLDKSPRPRKDGRMGAVRMSSSPSRHGVLRRRPDDGSDTLLS